MPYTISILLSASKFWVGTKFLCDLSDALFLPFGAEIKKLYGTRRNPEVK
jgi:hypothetical protein